MKGLKLATVVAACGLFFASPVLASAAETSKAAEDPGAYAELIALLEREISAQLTRHLQEKGRLRQVTVSVVVDPQKRRMVVDFGSGYLPGDDQNYGELFLVPLAADLRRYSEKSGLEILDVEFFFQGKPMNEHFPDDYPQPRLLKRRTIHSAAYWLDRVSCLKPLDRSSSGVCTSLAGIANGPLFLPAGSARKGDRQTEMAVASSVIANAS